MPANREQGGLGRQLSRGDASRGGDASVVLQSSWANTNAAEVDLLGELDEAGRRSARPG